MDFAGGFVFSVDEAVAEDVFWERQAGGHEHGGPECAMEACDVFSDDVDIGGPEVMEAGFVVGAIAQGGDVVEECIEPDVDGLIWVEGDGDSPGEVSSGDGDVAEFGSDDVDDFVAAGFGLDEVWLGIVEGEEFLLEGGEFEEVVFFFDGFESEGWVIGAFTFDEVAVGFEFFAAGAIEGGVGAFFDEAGVVDGLDEFLAADVVAWFRGLDEVVVGDIEGVPDFAELSRHVVDVGFGFEFEFGGALGDFDGVFVVSHLEVDIEALHSAETGLDIGADFFEGGADVWA